MCATYEVQVVLMQELGDHVGTERVRDAAVVLAPTHHVLVRVRPEEVAQQALVGHVGRSLDAANLFHRVEVRREAAVTAEDLFVDDGRHRQTIETVGERFPQLDVVASFACVMCVYVYV